MNRILVSTAMAFLIGATGYGNPLDAQASAHVEYRNGRIGVAVAIGDLPIRVHRRPSSVAGWVAVDWGPVRVWASSARPAWGREVLDRQDLRYLVGKTTVKRMEAHARAMRLRGPLEGRWFRMDRYSVMLEVSVRGVPVAELHDYGSDGYIDRVLLYRADGRIYPYKENPHDRRAVPRWGPPW